MDAILHTILGGAFGSLIYFMFLFLPPEIAAANSGSLYIFLREVGQVQSKLYDNNFRYGWNFWTWSRSKLAETFIPIVALIGASTLYWIMK